jgi:hypothetical protein
VDATGEWITGIVGAEILIITIREFGSQALTSGTGIVGGTGVTVVALGIVVDVLTT